MVKRKQQKLAKTAPSGGIKPLNAPRIVHVQIDSDGNPISVQAPPAIESPRARRTAKRRRRNAPHPGPLPSREREQSKRTSPPSLQGRELEGGLNRNPSTTNYPASKKTKATLLSDGRWMKVIEIENLWKVNDEWWRGPDEEIARLYYSLRLESGQQLTVYLDLITNNWYRQSG